MAGYALNIMKFPDIGSLDEIADDALTHRSSPVTMVYALGVMLCTAAVWYVARTQAEKQNQSQQDKCVETPALFGLGTWADVVLFCAYVVMSCSHSFFQHNAGITGSLSLVIVVVICILKFTISIMLFAFQKVSNVEPGAPVVWGYWVFLTCVPGCLYAAYDAMSFWSLSYISPLTYAVCIHLRIAITGVFYQVVFSRTLSMSQWFSFGLLVSAGLVQSLQQIDGDVMSMYKSSSSIGLLLILGQLCISAIASVLSEKVLKMKNISAPTELVIASQNVWSIAFLLFYLVVKEPGTYSWIVWQSIFKDKWVIFSILSMATFGIITCYFLRNLSSILREVVAGVAVLLTFMAQLGMGYEFSGLALLGALLSVAALSVYNLDPL